MKYSRINLARFEEPSYHDEKKQILGCKHYSRKAKLQADCCGKWVNCRFCHDESSSHEMPRKETKRMCCMICLTVQNPQQNCQHCHTELSEYYCSICKFWDDTPGKEIYHCEGCGMCRVGCGPNIDYIHCYDCTMCVPKKNFATHKCIEYTSKADCPICGEYLFTSIKPILFMPCEHMIHSSCHALLCQTSFQCPVCKKSLTNAHDQFSEIEATVKANPCKNGLLNQLQQEIQCYDCDSYSVVDFHPLYHKYDDCKSYSTKLIDTFNSTYAINPHRVNKPEFKISTPNKGSSKFHLQKCHPGSETYSVSTLINELETFYPYDNQSSSKESTPFESVSSPPSTWATDCSCSHSSVYSDECSCWITY